MTTTAISRTKSGQSFAPGGSGYSGTLAAVERGWAGGPFTTQTAKSMWSFRTSTPAGVTEKNVARLPGFTLITRCPLRRVSACHPVALRAKPGGRAAGPASGFCRSVVRFTLKTRALFPKPTARARPLWNKADQPYHNRTKSTRIILLFLPPRTSGRERLHRAKSDRESEIEDDIEMIAFEHQDIARRTAMAAEMQRELLALAAEFRGIALGDRDGDARMRCG